MPARWPIAIVGLFCLTSAMFIADRVAPQSAPSPTPAQQQGSTQSGYVLKVTTRLVTLDVTATDSRGEPVRDLKPEDLQVFEEHKAQQKIEHFEYFEKMKAAGPAEDSAAAIRARANLLSNQLPLAQLRIPPTVLLVDSLNTQTANQQQGHAHMLQLLRTLPQDTPIAVFLLGSSLKILQGFTSDGRLLRAALDQAVSGTSTMKYPRDDTNSTSNYYLEDTGGTGVGFGIAPALGE